MMHVGHSVMGLVLVLRRATLSWSTIGIEMELTPIAHPVYIKPHSHAIIRSRDSELSRIAADSH